MLQEKIDTQQIQEICLNFHNIIGSDNGRNNQSSTVLANLYYLFEIDSTNYLNQSNTYNVSTNNNSSGINNSDFNNNSMSSTLTEAKSMHTSSSPTTTSDQILNYVKMLCENYDMLNSESLVFSYKSILIYYLYPIILIFGILGNVISFLVMVKIYRLKKNCKFALDLATISFADLAVLIFGCFREYADDVLNFNLRSSSIYACKIIFFNCYLFSCFSAYLHAFIAIERNIAISSPLKSKTKFEKNNKILSLIFVACFVISSPLIYFPTIKQSITIDNANGVKIIEQCEVSHNNFYLNLTLTVIDSLFYCFIPFLITILFSGLTLVTLIRKKSAFNNLASQMRTSESKIGLFEIRKNEKNTFRRILKNRYFIPCKSIKSIKNENSEEILIENLPIKDSQPPVEGMLRTNAKKSSNLKITFMLLSLPISYSITTFPIFIIILFQLKYNYLNKKNTSNNFETEFSIAKMLMYFNNSINILFYILFGKNLRKDFIQIIPFHGVFNFLKKSKRIQIRSSQYTSKQTNHLSNKSLKCQKCNKKH